MPRRRKQADARKGRRSYLHFGVGFFIFFAGSSLCWSASRRSWRSCTICPSWTRRTSSTLGQTSRIYAADGSLLAEIYDTENRTVVPLSVDPRISQAGDHRHRGRALLRARRRRLSRRSAGRWSPTSAGAGWPRAAVPSPSSWSKRSTCRTSSSFTRKIVEAVLATQLERTATKDTILERYLNTIYYGENAYGVEAAAQTYFGKSVTQLDLAECALLAGLPQAPSAYSPKQDLAAATERRNAVLQKMADLGYINQAAAHGAASLPINLRQTAGGVNEPYFVEYVKQQLIDKYGAKKVFEGGLKVQTTIEPSLQAAGLEAIKNTLNEEGDPAAALVSIDPATGYIRAMVSSQDFKQSQFNLAVQARRQPGSCFKPFVLTAAVEQGADPKKTYYMSKQIDIPHAGRRPALARGDLR